MCVCVCIWDGWVSSALHTMCVFHLIVNSYPNNVTTYLSNGYIYIAVTHIIICSNGVSNDISHLPRVTYPL